MKCAAGGAWCNLEQYNGKMYALTTGWEIMELKDGKFEKIVNGAVSNFWHANGKMYAVTRDGSLAEFEEGSKKPNILVDEYSGYWNLVFGQYLYAREEGGISRVDLSAENPQKEMILKCFFHKLMESIFIIRKGTGKVFTAAIWLETMQS